MVWLAGTSAGHTWAPHPASTADALPCQSRCISATWQRCWLGVFVCTHRIPVECDGSAPRKEGVQHPVRLKAGQEERVGSAASNAQPGGSQGQTGSAGRVSGTGTAAGSSSSSNGTLQLAAAVPASRAQRAAASGSRRAAAQPPRSTVGAAAAHLLAHGFANQIIIQVLDHRVFVGTADSVILR